MSEVLRKFGRYFLLDKVAQGGMAEIFRARQAEVGQAVRLLVIKRIQGGFGENKDFKAMFQGETDVMLQFQHPNIIGLFDTGEEEGQPYLAMEYLDGKNLRELGLRFQKSEKPFPIELAVHIIEQASAGLHYAHTFKDKFEQKPLNVVHRDVSPQNILVSYEGHVKVIDFGIAKANTNQEATRAGTIKGKPSYMSPEQVGGEPLDGRSDVFSLGIVLWELLTGKKLFSAKGDLQILRLIEDCEKHVKPPSSENQYVPKELDYVVMRSLAKSRDKRYRNAEEFQKALRKFLNSFNPEFSASDASHLVKELFKEEIVADRKKVQRMNEEAERLLGIDSAESTQPKLGGSIGVVTHTGGATVGESTRMSQTMRSPSAIGKGEVVFTSAPTNPSIEIPKLVSEVPQNLGGARNRTRTANRISPVASKSGNPNEDAGGFKWFRAIAVLLILSGGGFWFLKFQSQNKPVIEPVSVTHSTPVQSQEPTIDPNAKNKVIVELVLGNAVVSPDTKITINSTPVSVQDPTLEVQPDQPIEVMVGRPGYKTVTRQFVVSSQKMGELQRSPAGIAKYQEKIDLEPIDFGVLSLVTKFSDSSYSFPVTLTKNGVTEVQSQTPLSDLRLSPGNYKLKVSHPAIKFDQEIFDIEVKSGFRTTKTIILKTSKTRY